MIFSKFTIDVTGVPASKYPARGGEWYAMSRDAPELPNATSDQSKTDLASTTWCVRCPERERRS